ncbi:TPM domain-containing protein [Methylacidimicrobium sp. B4]|uniref:TPM domain-containing protein n=1 Tax=Methylacidimicrobium sp. B4 TaxID=2796139 RepID=UPI001A8CCB89|nr:TPM domain-containing protein [Methylacidimicrobium sp. B4]QSR84820.1 TPM domain-containing protein [Methylacidimicrobium sp. B4]
MNGSEAARRFFRHWRAGSRFAARPFPPGTLERIEAAIAQAERRYDGEICFVIEHALDWRRLLRGMTARERACELFAQLGVWDTERNNGVLLYVLVPDRSIEIVADRAIHQAVGEAEWKTICSRMQAEFGKGRFLEGSLEAIQLVGNHLSRHFPAREGKRSELPDSPTVLDRGNPVSEGEGGS